MRASRLLAMLAVLLAAPFLFAACGDDDSSSQDEDDITAAIERAATTDDAANCTEVQTEEFNAQTEYTSVEEATAACEGNAGDGDIAGESVEVENVEVDGDQASAEVAFSGGSNDGQVIAISLVKEDDQWKLNSLDEFVSFDKESFANALVTAAEASGDVPQQVVDCLEGVIQDAPDEELQEIYLSGDEEQLLGLFGECA